MFVRSPSLDVAGQKEPAHGNCTDQPGWPQDPDRPGGSVEMRDDVPVFTPAGDAEI